MFYKLITMDTIAKLHGQCLLSKLRTSMQQKSPPSTRITFFSAQQITLGPEL